MYGWKTVFSTTGLIALLVVSGCSERPTEQESAVQTAVEAARQAQVEIYAPEAWVQAQDAARQAEAELQVQGGKWGLFRSYGKSSELLSHATALAESARQEAVTAKDRARQQTQAELDEAYAALEATLGLLAGVPRAKDTRAEIESMQQELIALRGGLDAATELARAEDFSQARAQVDQVSTQIQAIRDDLTAALAKVRK